MAVRTICQYRSRSILLEEAAVYTDNRQQEQQYEQYTAGNKNITIRPVYCSQCNIMSSLLLARAAVRVVQQYKHYSVSVGPVRAEQKYELCNACSIMVVRAAV